MPEPFRKLNDLGINRFRDFLDAGAKGPPPADLLVNPETSQPVARAPAPVQRTFENRYEFGRYLMELFADVPSDEITHEKGFWSAAALMWYDLIYDPQSMPPDNLVNLLPAEFDRWRNGIQNKATATAGSTDGSAEGLVAYAAAGPETT